MTIGCANDRFWTLTCRILGCPHLIEDPRFATKPERVRNIDALVEALTPYFERGTTAHWCAKLEAAGVPAGPVMNPRRGALGPPTASPAAWCRRSSTRRRGA